MRSKKNSSKKLIVPVRRSIKTPPRTEPVHPGQAAVTAAALHQLNRYADDIQQFLRASKMQTLLDRLQADLDGAAAGTPRVRRR